MTLPPAPDILPVRKFEGRVVAVMTTADPSGFETTPVERLTLELGGVPGDRHYGFTREAGAREPWYRRGTEMRSGRQLSIVSVEELAEIARLMDLPEVRAEWIGANLAVEGVPRLSFLPAGTRLHFPDGAALCVEGQNAPCRFAGGAVAEHYPDRDGLDLEFPKSAQRLRGLVATVERAGGVQADEIVSIRVPEQWIYPS